MSEQDTTTAGEGHDVQLWEPQRVLRRVNPSEAKLSRGFLRCRPEKWFPAFATHWQPIIHALGVEARISEIKPVLAKPPLGDVAYVASVSGERIVVAMESAGADSLCDELSPGSGEKASKVVLEYFCRRFIASLALSWSGPESATVRFERDSSASEVTVAGSIRIGFTVNTVPFTLWIGLGPKLVEMLDGLWRRQVQTLSKVAPGTSTLRLELAQLGVPPQMLSEYLTKGTVIDLEVKASDTVTIKVGNKPWMPARLVDVGGSFACEMTPGALTVPQIAEGATQLSVEVGTLTVDSAQIAELGQAGAILVTGVPVSGIVQLVINQERVAEARLCMYEGRFAIEVQ